MGTDLNGNPLEGEQLSLFDQLPREPESPNELSDLEQWIQSRESCLPQRHPATELSVLESTTCRECEHFRFSRLSQKIAPCAKTKKEGLEAMTFSEWPACELFKQLEYF